MLVGFMGRTLDSIQEYHRFMRLSVDRVVFIKSQRKHLKKNEELSWKAYLAFVK